MMGSEHQTLVNVSLIYTHIPLLLAAVDRDSRAVNDSQRISHAVKTLEYSHIRRRAATLELHAVVEASAVEVMMYLHLAADRYAGHASEDRPSLTQWPLTRSGRNLNVMSMNGSIEHAQLSVHLISSFVCGSCEQPDEWRCPSIVAMLSMPAIRSEY